ncbi:transcriptional regulator [Sphingobacterium faecium NBRC 15299]|uniref:ArsR/SmtB family transcription factor n=1 Tax=Sphingobacterium faecium TaxID=34087 RepID=UPI000D39F2EB|nr:metalloregulator ArsR/SmtB family transcription factor [Sphingobacterium faecium]PTX10434.1 ArsR family transcriptional regulator [Sphingobacterium faecium]GEM64265.1 transcriptional regulator [Sphingobacterium faecium NBRC 15299]
MVDIFKILANEHRLQILHWLKNPNNHFNAEDIEPEVTDYGVCMSVIQKKAGLSQSTISSYLTSMVNCGLLKSVREGQWTYYKRNEKRIQELASYIKDTL